MDPNGENQRHLSRRPDVGDLFPSWSHDGVRVVFTSRGDGVDDEIFIVNADGSSPVQLTDNDADDSIPRVSPDGAKILFISERDGNAEIYVMDVDGSNQVNLSNTLRTRCPQTGRRWPEDSVLIGPVRQRPDI